MIKSIMCFAEGKRLILSIDSNRHIRVGVCFTCVTLFLFSYSGEMDDIFVGLMGRRSSDTGMYFNQKE